MYVSGGRRPPVSLPAGRPPPPQDPLPGSSKPLFLMTQRLLEASKLLFFFSIQRIMEASKPLFLWIQRFLEASNRKLLFLSIQRLLEAFKPIFPGAHQTTMFINLTPKCSRSPPLLRQHFLAILVNSSEHRIMLGQAPNQGIRAIWVSTEYEHGNLLAPRIEGEPWVPIAGSLRSALAMASAI